MSDDIGQSAPPQNTTSVTPPADTQMANSSDLTWPDSTKMANDIPQEASPSGQSTESPLANEVPAPSPDLASQTFYAKVNSVTITACPGMTHGILRPEYFRESLWSDCLFGYAACDLAT